MAATSRRTPASSFQFNSNGGTLFGASHGAVVPAPEDDPLQPLRAMADRVGKEVADFAMRVDNWHSHGNESATAKYQTTLHMVGKFKDLADATVKELEEQNAAENRGELQKSVRRRIKTMAEEKRPHTGAEHVHSFASVVPTVELSSIPQSERVQELRQWQAEAATWDLLRIIIEHYHPEPGTDVAAEKRALLENVGGKFRYSPNSEIWDRFLLEDDQAKEKELVLRWLEETARNSESDVASITKQLEEESGKDTDTWTSGWLDTKARIQQAKRMQIVPHMEVPLPEGTAVKTVDRTRDLVTRLDPDAPTRQKRALEKADEYYERALWMVCYEMLRRGVSRKEIDEWCTERGEQWRGCTMGAVSVTSPDGGPQVTGPTVGYLFRRMAFYAAKGSRTQYEGAVYGLLSGEVKEVEQVCRSWDDFLYARYNALLLSRFDNYLLKNYSHRISQPIAEKFIFQDATATVGSWESSSADVIEHLKDHKTTAALSVLPMKLIQGSLISRNMEDLVYGVGAAIAIMLQNDDRSTRLVLDPEADPSQLPSSNTPQAVKPEKYHQALASDPNGLRVLVHIFIVLRKGLGLFNMDGYAQWAALDNVIVAYIEFLRINRKFQLIPLYAAQLEGTRCSHTLARILPDINHPSEQKKFVELMEQYNIDPLRVITENYELVTNTPQVAATREYIDEFEILEDTGELEYLWPRKRIIAEFPGLEVNENDQAVLESMRWHLHLDKEIQGSFVVLQSGLAYLLRTGRTGAAIQLVTEINIENISLSRTRALCGYSFDFTAPGADRQDEAAAKRGRAANGGRTVLGPRIPTASQHAELVRALNLESRTYQDLQQLVRLLMLFQEWRAEEALLIASRARSEGAKPDTSRVKAIFEALQSTLEPMLESFMDYAPNEPQTNAWAIKKVYIPVVILAYISVIQTAAYFTSRELATKAMDLATVVADPEKGEWLQDVFLGSRKMTALVDMLAHVSRAMLRMTEMDPRAGREGKKKRVSRGETLKVWCLHGANKR